MSKFVEKEISKLDIKGSAIEKVDCHRLYKNIILYTFNNSMYQIPDEKGELFEFIKAFYHKNGVFPSLRLIGDIWAREPREAKKLSLVSFELLKEEDETLPPTSAQQSLSDRLKKVNGAYFGASQGDTKSIPVYNLLTFLDKEQDHYLSMLAHVQAPENKSYLEGGIKLIIKIRDFIAAHK